MKSTNLAAAASTAALVAAGPALAGGVAEPQPEPVVQPAPVVSVYDWTGGYVGLQFGAIDSDIDTSVDILDEEYELGKNADGTTFGIYGGYNWQMGTPWVYGVEAEYNGVDADDDASVDVRVVNGTTETTAEAEIDATAAVRGRVGYAFDRALLYATGGLAYVDYEVTSELQGDSDSTSADNWGWTLGVGVEYAFTDNWVGRVDYRYSDYDGEDGSWYEGDSDYDLDLETNELRLGVSYRF
jgi:outer membrane immunogenic protein